MSFNIMSRNPFAARPAALTAGAALALALLAGCGAVGRDHVVVGSVPDDYRTNHPIVVAEKEQRLDLPVAAGDRGVTAGQRTAVLGFVSQYDRTAASQFTILAPSGSANELAARRAARDFAEIARKNGVPAGSIAIAAYQAGPEERSAPVRLSFSAMRAHTDRCGRWPDDVLNNADNKHYANFGCSYQNNLAAQIANPSDLLGPRKMTEINATRRTNSISDYENRASDWAEPPSTEVDY